MLNIPDIYVMNRKIALKTILAGDLKAAEKKRLKAALKGVTLTHQIHGESIPSWIDKQYRYEVILFLEVRVKDIKRTEFMAPIFQKIFKPPCVISFHDDFLGCISFADKQINPQNDQDIVLMENFTTPCQPLEEIHHPGTPMGKIMDFNAVMNVSHKRAFYLETMTKAFIAGNVRLYSKIMDFIDTPIWYDPRDVMMLLKYLLELKQLNGQKKHAVEMKEKVALNQQIKQTVDKLNLKLEA